MENRGAPGSTTPGQALTLSKAATGQAKEPRFVSKGTQLSPVKDWQDLDHLRLRRNPPSKLRKSPQVGNRVGSNRRAASGTREDNRAIEKKQVAKRAAKTCPAWPSVAANWQSRWRRGRGIGGARDWGLRKVRGRARFQRWRMPVCLPASRNAGVARRKAHW